MIPEKGLGKHKRSFERVDPLPFSLLQVCNCDQHCTTTSKHQSNQFRTWKEPSGTAEKEGLQDSKTKASTIGTSMECERICKASEYQVRRRIEKKSSVYSQSGNGLDSNEIPALEEPVLNIKGDVPHTDLDNGDTECVTDIDEPVLNITGFNDFCSGKIKDLVEGKVHAVTKEQAQACIGEAHQVVKGVSCVQRERLKSDLDSLASQENEHLGETGKTTDLMLERDETNESKACKNSPGRSWVQKASWKSLVGETGRMSFSLGSMLNQNLVDNPKSTNKELVQPITCEDDWDDGGRIVQTPGGSKPCSTIDNEIQQIFGGGNLLLSKKENAGDRGSTFMKSSTPKQEWLESKQVVKRIMKRSRKDAPKALKVLHTKQKH